MSRKDFGVQHDRIAEKGEQERRVTFILRRHDRNMQRGDTLESEGNVKPLSSYFMVVGLERGFNVKFYKVNRHNFQKLDHDEKEDCCFGFTDPHCSEYPGWPQNILVGQCVIY